MYHFPAEYQLSELLFLSQAVQASARSSLAERNPSRAGNSSLTRRVNFSASTPCEVPARILDFAHVFKSICPMISEIGLGLQLLCEQFIASLQSLELELS